jgi:hypothetical protein
MNSANAVFEGDGMKGVGVVEGTLPDRRDLNLDELGEVVLKAFKIRHEAPPFDELVLRAHSRIIKGLLLADTTMAAMALPIAIQKVVDAYLEGGR